MRGTKDNAAPIKPGCDTDTATQLATFHLFLRVRMIVVHLRAEKVKAYSSDPHLIVTFNYSHTKSRAQSQNITTSSQHFS